MTQKHDRTRRLTCHLSEDAREMRRSKAEALFESHLRAYRDTETGWAFRFAGDEEVFERVVAFVEAERECCPFLEFELTLKPEEGPIWLEILGDDQVQSFIADHLVAEFEEMIQS